MHPDLSSSGVKRVVWFPLSQVSRFQNAWRYSWRSAAARHPVGDMQYTSGTLAHLCREVASPGCVFAGGLIEKLQEPLATEERSDIENAVLKRQREFIAGRTSARMALMQMGYTNQSVPRSASRAPLWPEGVVGSISHNSHYCVAVTSLSSLNAGIGIDIESPVGLSPDLVNLVCTPSEMEFLSHRSDPVRGKLAKLFFSAKESVYKCIFPVFGEQLEFEAVEIALNIDARTFQATVTTDAHGTVENINGHFASSDHLLLTLAVLPSPLTSHSASPSTSFLPLHQPETAPCREPIR